MPPTHTDEGVRAAVRLRRDHPGLGVLVLSQYVEEQYATELLAGSQPRRRLSAQGPGGRGAGVRGRGGPGGRGAVRRWTRRSWRSCWAAAVSRTCWPVSRPREREVLGLMAEGRTNSAVARQLVVSDGAVEKHVSNIFLKLGLSPSDGDHRRVLAVLTYLNS